MKLLHVVTITAGLAVAGTPAIAAMTAPTMEQISGAQTATIVEFDSAVGLPESIVMDYDIADLQQWVGTNPALSVVFEQSEYDALDVEAAGWENGTLTLYVDRDAANEGFGDS